MSNYVSSLSRNLAFILAALATFITIFAPNSRAAGGYADAVMADGPIAYYRFNDGPPTAVNSGSLGAALNGTYNGGATSGTQAPAPPAFVGFEPSNTALQCNGTDAFVGTMSTLFNGRTAFTVSSWIRRNGDQANRTGIWGQNDIMEVGYINNTTLEAWTDNGLHQNDGATPSQPFPNGDWAHLAIVSEGSPGLIKMYTNGVFANQRTHTLPGAQTFFFNMGGGGVFDATGNFFNGQIDEVAVYDKALSAGQIAAQYGAAFTPIAPFPKFVNVGGNAIGTSTFDQPTGTLTIVGGGNDIWNQIDEFAYAYDNKVGDFDVKVRVESLSPNNRWSKAGIMVRESLAEDSRMVFLRVAPVGPTGAPADNPNGANDIKLGYRTGAPDVAGETGGEHEDPADQNPPPYPNAWLRVVRSGNVFSAQISSDGSAWTQITSQDTAASADWTAGGGPFRKDALVGLAVSRHSGGASATAVFHDIAFQDAATFSVVQASSRGNPNGILVSFNKAPDAATLLPGNFDVQGPVNPVITSISSGPQAHSYWLNTQDPLTEGGVYSVSAFSVTAGGTESPIPDGDMFTHGAGYENVGIHVGHNKEPVFGLGGHRARTHTARGLYSTAEGRAALESNPVFEDPLPDNGSNERYTGTIFGILNVTTAGAYQFACSSDDIGELLLSTDANPANKVLIAREPVWNGSRQYAVVDRRAAQADLPQNTVRPNLTPAITLAAGEYYLEYVYNEGGGGNNGSAAWAPAGTAIGNGATPIDTASFAPSRYFNGSERGELFRNLGAVAITRQPASQTVIGGNPVTFSVGVDGTPAYRFQWRRNGQPIPGANGPSYTIAVALATDDGASFSCSVANEFSSASSAEAVLTVNIPTPPVVLSASPDETFARVTVRFDKRVQPSSAQLAANYTISGGVTVNSATLDASGTGVVLATTTLGQGTTYTLTIRDVREVTGNNALSPNPTMINFTTLLFSPGFAKKEYYQQWSGGAGSVDAFIAAQRAGTTPLTRECYVNLWEQNTFDEYENYGGRIFGFVVPPVSGDYVFYFASDDYGRLFLSTDDSPANVVEIAREPVWSGRRTWVGEAGGGGRGTPPVNISVPIALVAGQKYYMESYFTEGGGGDNMAVAVQGPGAPVPVNGDLPVGGAYIGTVASPVGASASITQQPLDVTRPENTFATFTAAGTGSSAGCGSVTSYQWYRNGVPIAGATSPTLSVGPVTILGDDGALFRVRVAVVGAYADSADARLTVVEPRPLTVVRAEGVCNLRQVRVVYDQFVDPTNSVDEFNYTIEGFGISAVALNADNLSVTLTLDPAGPAQTPGANYCVVIDGVTSLSGQLLAPNPTTACFQACVVSCGFALQELYFGIGGVNISDLLGSPNYPGNPSQTRYKGGLSANDGDEFDNYGTRISGWLIPPISGAYVFYLAADDGADFWLSTDADAANLVQIAAEPIWAARRNYIGEADGGGRAGVTTYGGPQANISGNINLVAGQMYYFEARMKEGGGGDNLDVAWQVPGGPAPTDGSPAISGLYLASLASPAGSSLAINRQPCANNICLAIPGRPAPPAGGSPLSSQDFNSGDGGCTVINNRAFEGPWIYNAGLGTWSSAGQQAEIGAPGPSSRLSCPAVTVTRSGNVRVSVAHRHSFEGGNWDGGQIQVSINGGDFATVPGSSFTQNGYNGSVVGNSAAEIKGQAAFVLDSTGYGSGTFITSTADLGCLAAGDTIAVRFLSSHDTNTRQGNPAWEIDSVSFTEAVSSGSIANFSVGATASTPGNPNQAIFYQWQRSVNGGPYINVAGGNGPTLSFQPTLADNGNCYRAILYIPGTSATSEVACLTVAQPNTEPQFTCGPNVTGPEDSGPVSAFWASDIQNHSIPRTRVIPFNTQPPNTTLDGVAAVDLGILKLTTPVNSAYGVFTLNLAGVQTYPTFEASWKSLIGGGGGGGADGYSLSVGTDLASPPAYGNPGEEGTGTGLIVAVDTFDNGVGLDPSATGLEIHWGGAIVASMSVPKDNPGTGNYLRKNSFVNAAVTVDSTGLATFTYDGNTITASLAGYAGITADKIMFGARTGGANDNQWIDDLSGNEWLDSFLVDAASVEGSQTVQFVVTANSNPSLFASGPTISPNGTLSYTPAPNACGTANITVVLMDNGGTDCSGNDTSAPCTFAINVTCVCDPAVANNDTGNTRSAIPVTIDVLANDIAGEGTLTIVAVTQGANGAVVNNGNNVTYTSAANYAGTDTFTYTVANTCGERSTATVTVTVVPDNQPPTAVIHSDQLINLKPEYEDPVLLSCNWWNACLVADGWTSSDPENGDLTYVWTLGNDPVPFGVGPVVTNCLEVGRHTIHLTVTDPGGLQDTASKTIEVVTAPLAIELLIEQINESHKSGVVLSRKTKRELTETLRVALRFAGEEKLRETQKALDAFEKKVRAQVAPTEPEAARVWILWSQAVSDGMEKCIKPPRKSKDHHDDKKDDDKKDDLPR